MACPPFCLHTSKQSLHHRVTETTEENRASLSGPLCLRGEVRKKHEERDSLNRGARLNTSRTQPIHECDVVEDGNPVIAQVLGDRFFKNYLHGCRR